MPSQEDFLNSSSGESYEPVKFLAIDDSVGGVIMSDPRPIERPSLKDGSPETQLPVNIQTKDGPRTLWVRQGFLAGALAEAVREVGESELKKDGKIAVQLVELRDTGKPNPAKVFRAKYEPPKKEEPAGASIEEIFNQ